MTEKSCGHHHHHERRRFYRKAATVSGSLIVLVALTILIVFLVLQPKKPRFVLQDVTVYAFNVSSPYLLTTNIQVTVSSRNLNDRIGVLYDKLDIFASYRDQQFTMATVLPTTYQAHGDAALWSPFLYGNAVPVSPLLTASLDQDRIAGTVLLDVRIKGTVRWKVGTWISGRYRLFVTCPAYISLGKQSAGIAVGPAMKFQVSQSCSVDVSTD